MKSLKLHLLVSACVLVALRSPAWAASPVLPVGQTVAGTISAAAQTNSYAFSATISEVLDFTATTTTGNFSPKLQLYNSAGTLIAVAYPNDGFGGCSGGSTIEMNTILLPATGTYTLDVSDCSGTNTGDYDLYAQSTNYPVGAGKLTSGQTQAGSITLAAQSNTYTFSANVNDEIDFTLTTTSGSFSPKIRVYNTDGSQLGINYPNDGFGGCSGGSTIELNTLEIPKTGTYTVLVGDCGDTNTGKYEIYAQRTDHPSPATNLPFGQTLSGAISSAAQSNTYIFSANANDVLIFTMVTTKGSLSPKVRIYEPNGTPLGQPFYPNDGFGGCSGGATVEGTVTIPVSGTYTLLAGDCSDTNTGDYNIYSQRINNPSGAAIFLFGPVQSNLIGSAAQGNTYIFSGNANEVVDFTMATTTGNLSPKIRLYEESNATLLSQAYPNDGFGGCSGGPTLEMNTITLPANGAYVLIVGDCSDTDTGNYSIYAQSTNDPFGPGPVDWGQVQTGSIAGFAQSNTYTFSGVAKNVIDFTMVTTNGSLSPKIRLYNPDGTLNTEVYPNDGFGGCSGGSTVEMNSVTLSQNGDYTVLVDDCSDTNTGTYDLSSQCFGTCLAMPAITWPTPAAIAYGTPLSGVQLDASANVAGNFAYSPDSGTVLHPGPYNLSVTFTPTDTKDYSPARDFVQLTVNKAAPVIAWSTPAPITYGTALSATQLDATANVGGSLVYSPAAGAVPPVGVDTLSVTFTPTDTTDYTTATKTVQLTVTNTTPSVVSVTPNPATGLSNTFALEYSDTGGNADLTVVAAIFNSTAASKNSCYAYYAPATNRLYLQNDAGTGATFITPGSGTLSNSQCAINGSKSSVVKSGDNLTLNLDVTASSSFIQTKNVYMLAEDSSSNTGWIKKGTWAPSSSSVPSVVSGTPNPASGVTQAFALEYSDTGGYPALTTVAVIFNATVSSKSSCYAYYVPATNLLYLQNDSGSGATSITPGSGALSNSQCTISGSRTSVTGSSDDLTLNLAVTASGTFTGTKNIYMLAEDSNGNTGWLNKGIWTP